MVTYEKLQFCDNLPSGPQGSRELVLVPLELWGGAAEIVKGPNFFGDLRLNVVWYTMIPGNV
jgi:hypothetical protein